MSSLRAARPLAHSLEVLDVLRKERQRDVDVRGAERLLPVVRDALADVAERGGARRHALAELRREAVERHLRHAERPQPVIGEGDRDPGAVRGLVRRGGLTRPAGGSRRTSSRPAARIVDAQQDVGPDVGRRTLVQRAALDVVQLKGRRRRRWDHGQSRPPQWACGGGGFGGSGFGAAR